MMNSLLISYSLFLIDNLFELVKPNFESSLINQFLNKEAK